MIGWAGLEPGAVTHTADTECARQHLLVYTSDDSVQEGDEILYSDLSRVQVIRAASVLETEVTIEDYRTGPLRRMAKLMLRELLGIARTH